MTVKAATARYGASPRCTPRKCQCGAVILTGWDADAAAFHARVDPTPLGPVGLALARLGRRPVYRLIRAGPKARITAGPVPLAGPPWDWVPAHRCGEPLPGGPSIWDADGPAGPDPWAPPDQPPPF